MLKALILSALVFALAACGAGEPLATCKGPVFQLNAEHWNATPADLVKPKTVASKE